MSDAAATGTPPVPREVHRAHAERLEWLTVGWNVAEAAIAIAAALGSGSVALLGFGLDSVIESASGGVLLWRLRAEHGGLPHAQVERLDHGARRAVAVTLFALAAWVAYDACRALLVRERPETSAVGAALTAVSLFVMLWLARAKRRAAAALQSRALQADAFQTTACWWLSLITLGGLAANGLLGWWWADPLAALAMTPLIVHEGREAWRGEECGCHG